ncbi:hypothetical protein BH11ARM1_BH11ARM1_18290 [soil metagenome]
MKRFVDGVEMELSDDVQISDMADRQMVHCADGTFSAVAVQQGEAVLVSYRGNQYRVEKKSPKTRATSGSSSGEIRAPMPGQIVDVRVSVGQAVAKGDVLLVLEAMKTQQPFHAPFEGKVSKLSVKVGDQVTDGLVMAVVEP